MRLFIVYFLLAFISCTNDNSDCDVRTRSSNELFLGFKGGMLYEEVVKHQNNLILAGKLKTDSALIYTMSFEYKNTPLNIENSDLLLTTEFYNCYLCSVQLLLPHTISTLVDYKHSKIPSPFIANNILELYNSKYGNPKVENIDDAPFGNIKKYYWNIKGKTIVIEEKYQNQEDTDNNKMRTFLSDFKIIYKDSIIWKEIESELDSNKKNSDMDHLKKAKESQKYI